MNIIGVFYNLFKAKRLKFRILNEYYFTTYLYYYYYLNEYNYTTPPRQMQLILKMHVLNMYYSQNNSVFIIYLMFVFLNIL